MKPHFYLLFQVEASLGLVLQDWVFYYGIEVYKAP